MPVSSLLRFSALTVLLLGVGSADAQEVQPRPLITSSLDESRVVTLPGNVHPLAQLMFDVGAAPPDLPMNRMMLVLKRDPMQDLAIRKLLDDQQDKNSPNYHKWLTPARFGTQFGAADQDLQVVTGWLQSHGFQINRVSNGRTAIEFSGVEAQVETAFHTQIHQYVLPNGEQHWANTTDPQIPAALAPAVEGVVSLHDFPRKSLAQILGKYNGRTGQLSRNNPQFTTSFQGGTAYAVGPADFGTIYNLQPLWNAGTDGTGQKIAIVAQTDINIQDVRDFRNMFGLPVNDPVIIYNGPNPGIIADESESDIDVQWAGAIAPKATVNLVVSESTETAAGVDLSAIYIVDNNLAPVMSVSYGFCELGLGTAGNQFYNNLWQQAAAQGITVVVASGDNGSAGCDFASGNTPQPAQYGLAVSGYASTPFNVAVGGTDFNDAFSPLTYWNTTNTSPTLESAKGYIPEVPWNDSCTNPVLSQAGFSTNAETNCNDSRLSNLVWTVGGSGGVSNCTVNSQTLGTCSGGYTKPSWQVGTLNDGKRDVPDVSFFASNGFMGNFYIYCQADAFGSCSTFTFGAAGGTSFGAPIFAGVMALVNQQMQTPEGQGNPNYILYKLASQQTASTCNSSTGPASSCVFNDVTSGTIAMPCQNGSPNCTVTTAGHAYGVLSGYSTGTGYDLATGLGTINVANLLSKWNSVTFRPTTTTLTLNPTSNLTHGQSVTVTGSVSPSSGSGVPTGSVSLLTSSGQSAGNLTLSNGTLSGSTTLLPGGTYTVSAHYAGDTTFGGSDSTPVNITIGKENSTPQIRLETFDWQGNLISWNATTAVYGSPYLLRVDVLNASGSSCQGSNGLPQFSCPTGTISLSDNGNSLDLGTYSLNSMGYAEDQFAQFPGGSHSVQAQYAGDGSFIASSASGVFNITQAPTNSMLSAPGQVTVGSNGVGSVFLQSVSSGVAPTGTVSFYIDGALSPIQGTIQSVGRCGNLVTWCANSSGGPSLSTSGTHVVTATYNGDSNYAPSSTAPVNISAFYATSSTLSASTVSPSAGSSVTLTALVDTSAKNLPLTGSVIFRATTTFVGTPVNLFGNTTITPVTDANGNSALQVSLTTVPIANSMNVWAQFMGDSNYAYSASNSILLNVAGNDFTLTLGPSLTMSQGTTGNTSFEIDAQSGYTGTVNFTSASVTGLPGETTVSFTPSQIFKSGSGSIVITTTSPHAAVRLRNLTSATRWNIGIYLPAMGIVGLSIPRRRRSKLSYGLSAIAVLCLTFLIACGGGAGSGTGGTGNGGGAATDPGTPKGSYKITLTATSDTGITHTGTFMLSVQ